MGDFKHGTFHCFDDITTCLITYFLPCITAGKNAEHVNENCLLYGCLGITCVGPITRAMIRAKIREKHSIKGSCPEDFLCHLFCPFCSLVQESLEAQDHGAPKLLPIARE
ncbi:uncharacterized protein LOC100210338 isoform X1 [Hydra vulgaris]|uniref:uncharacterized protein LOC100210338 isoform X1 n=1 Tax=Hydra vulgaris TaxID=6087 RepID=UPI00019242E7|nr:protein PLANT CADMIUM RESISTANCE 4 [Hydra vulgaris]